MPHDSSETDAASTQSPDRDTRRSDLRRRDVLKALGLTGVSAAGLGAASGGIGVGTGRSQLRNAEAMTPPPGFDPYSPGIVDPVRYRLTDKPKRKTNTQQVTGLGELVQKVSYDTRDVRGQPSLRGHTIEHVANPYDDLANALQRLASASATDDTATLESAATEVERILDGETAGRIYDGFHLLNYNKGGVTDDHVDGEYRMKRLTKAGETTTDTVDGTERDIWEVTVNMFWHGDRDGGKFDSDTFVLVAPQAMDALHDPMRVHYRFYSLVDEEFAPTSMLRDSAVGPLQLPFTGMDSVWTLVPKDSLTEITVDLPPPQMLVVIYHWGWRAHPPRIQAIHPVREIENVHTGELQLNGEGRSLSRRWREIGIEDIGDAAPEKKMYTVATAVLDDDAAASEVNAMLTDPDTDPRGTWETWIDIATDHRQLPPEAIDRLEAEGIEVPDRKLNEVEGDTIGPYRQVNATMNHETWGAGPMSPDIDDTVDNSIMRAYSPGEQFDVKTINLDEHTRYYRTVEFHNALNDAVKLTQGTGGHAFQVFNFKPIYGVNKSAEAQWRTGWGFRPGLGIIQQWDVWSRPCDRTELTPFLDEDRTPRAGYRYSAGYRAGGTRSDRPTADDPDFRFNPPPPLTTGDRLTGADTNEGLVIGTRTEGYGVAKMCSNAEVPPDDPCPTDLSDRHPLGPTNIDTDGDGEPDALVFPPFLRNPDPQGGDIIPPTPLWKWFLHVNPDNGTIYLDPDNEGKGFWVDKTYVFGRPIEAGEAITATFETPREAGQVFYQFDPLFHDQSVFSIHPLSTKEAREEMKIDTADTVIRENEVAQHGQGDQLFTAQDEVPIDEGRKQRGLTEPMDASLSVEGRHECDR